MHASVRALLVLAASRMSFCFRTFFLCPFSASLVSSSPLLPPCSLLDPSLPPKTSSSVLAVVRPRANSGRPALSAFISSSPVSWRRPLPHEPPLFLSRRLLPSFLAYPCVLGSGHASAATANAAPPTLGYISRPGRVSPHHPLPLIPSSLPDHPTKLEELSFPQMAVVSAIVLSLNSGDPYPLSPFHHHPARS